MTIKILDEYGNLHPRLQHEPKHRLSQSQKESLIQVGKLDSNAYVSGLDESFHPVVTARMPGPNGNTRYALDKAGSAKQVKGKLAERW
jgi:hypothetical protein